MAASSPDRFGANAWLVDEMYDLYRSDPGALSQEWRDFFEGFAPRGANQSRPRPEPTAADLGVTGDLGITTDTGDGGIEAAGTGDGVESIEPLRGSAARLAANMQASLSVPTATSFRVVPARLLEVNRRILNNQLERTSATGKVSFTHLIGYAVLEGLRAVPAMTSSYAGAATASGDVAGGAAVVHHAHVWLGLAVDTKRPDGGHNLLVPVIKDADTLDFR
ncbi:MAG: 2-oxo acid dehydrogenase subunit E2, partial [Acidimicrobiales bacterium]